MIQKAQKAILHSMHKGKSRFAQGLDLAFCALLADLLLYLWFYRQVRSTGGAALLSLIVTALLAYAYFVWRRMRRQRYLRATWRQMRDALALEQLLMLPDAQATPLLEAVLAPMEVTLLRRVRDGWWEACCGAEQLLVHFARAMPDTPLERGALLCAMRTAQARGLPLFIMTTGLLDEAAQGFIGRMENLFASPISADTLLAAIRRAGRLPSDEAVARYALDVLAQKQVRTSFFKTALSPGRARIYLLSGALMLVLSFFVVFPTYYRIVGALSLGLGVASILRREAQITTRRHAS